MTQVLMLGPTQLRAHFICFQQLLLLRRIGGGFRFSRAPLHTTESPTKAANAPTQGKQLPPGCLVAAGRCHQLKAQSAPVCRAPAYPPPHLTHPARLSTPLCA